MSEISNKLIQIITDAAHPIQDHTQKYASLLDKIGNARFVLMGEATHGTQEFYQTRIEISQALIQEKNFMAIAIEGDWPDAYAIHEYVQGKNKKKPEEALNFFNHFPFWMWRNKTVLNFLKWLRLYNKNLKNKIGFYGLDLYSLYSSLQAVINYLDEIDSSAAQRARERYGCFARFNFDPQEYGYHTFHDEKQSCIKQALAELMELQQHAKVFINKKEHESEENYFYALQNARLVKNAEHYYRAMYGGRNDSWNVRDRHMAETLNVLADHLENRYGEPAKVIVWAHNSHVGDARATEMGDQGEVNIGQLTREMHDRDTFLLGFSTYDGTVTAASEWGDPAELKTVNPGIPGSYEALFHEVSYTNFWLDLHDQRLEHYLQHPRLQRAIGVIYKPESERWSHYSLTRLPLQFDAIIHLDHTTAVEPL